MELWQRFSNDARRTVLAAHRGARGCRSPLIYPEHLLLGLLRVRRGPAAEVLHTLGVDTGDLADELLSKMAPASDRAEMAEIAFTPEAQRVLQRAYREYRQTGSELLGTEHVLLGLLQESAELAALLGAQGAGLEAVRSALDASAP